MKEGEKVERRILATFPTGYPPDVLEYSFHHPQLAYLEKADLCTISMLPIYEVGMMKFMMTQL